MSAAARASTFLLRLLARVRFAYVRLLEFGDGWTRFLNYVDDRGFDNRGNWRLRRPRFFRATFFARGLLALATPFLGRNLVAVRLAALPRTDWRTCAPCRALLTFFFVQ